jgi:hypothetical protein
MILDFEPGDKVLNLNNKDWGIGQVQSIIKEKERWQERRLLSQGKGSLRCMAICLRQWRTCQVSKGWCCQLGQQVKEKERRYRT